MMYFVLPGSDPSGERLSDDLWTRHPALTALGRDGAESLSKNTQVVEQTDDEQEWEDWDAPLISPKASYSAHLLIHSAGGGSDGDS